MNISRKKLDKEWAKSEIRPPGAGSGVGRKSSGAADGTGKPGTALATTAAPSRTPPTLALPLPQTKGIRNNGSSETCWFFFIGERDPPAPGGLPPIGGGSAADSAFDTGDKRSDSVFNI